SVAHIVGEKNWIVDCGYGHGIQKGSAINVDVSGVDGKPSLLNTDIIIQNNVIQTQGQMAIYIAGSKNVAILNNNIEDSTYGVVAVHNERVTKENNGRLPNKIDD